MKIRSGSLIVCLLTGMMAQAQVAVNTTGASLHNSAMLDVASTTKGLLVPRMTGTERMAIASPATGLLVYDISSSLFYYYNGTAWTALPEPAIWSLNGNGNTVSGTDFLGTTDNQALDIRANNIIHTRIRTTGQIEVLNTGMSTYLGDGVARFDDQNNRRNTGVGSSAFQSMSSGTGNTAIGTLAQQSVTSSYNTAVGYFSMGSASSTGTNNTALGALALLRTTSGSYNTAFGGQALRQNTTGSYNVGIGFNCHFQNTTGIGNIAVGASASFNNTTGQYNTGIGYNVLSTNSVGTNITVVGGQANVAVNNLSNATAIGYSAQAAQSNTLVLGGTAANAVNAGIGTTAPLSTLDIAGATGMAIKNAQTAGTANPDNTASVWCYTAASGTITLPVAGSFSNRLYVIVNQTGSAVNISSYNDLAGITKTIVDAGSSITIVSNGVNWLQIR
jgi:hypothetical protein